MLLTAAVDGLCVLLLTLLAVKGIVGEDRVPQALGALAFCAAFAGGLPAGKGRLGPGGSLLNAGAFALLLLLLCTKVLKLEAIEATGNFLLDTMPIMFIPASVGLIDSYDAMKAILIPLIVTCLISTVVVMGVTGKVTEFMVKLLKKNETNAGEETRA